MPFCAKRSMMVMIVVYARGRVRDKCWWMSRTVPSPSGQSALMHSSSSGAKSKMECRGPRPRFDKGKESTPLPLCTRTLQSVPRNFWRSILGLRFFRAPEQINAEESPLQRRTICRPVAFARGRSQGGTDRAHLGIQIVQIVKHQGFAEHGKLGRTKFVLPVMADEHVLNQRLQVPGKSRNRIHFFRDLLVLDQDVPEQLALVGVAEGPLIAQLLQFSEVVQDRARQQ